MENISEKGHQRGNFHQYYNFHPISERTSHLKPGIFVELWKSIGNPSLFSILDVGCNEGLLSAALFDQARRELPGDVKCVLLGIDIDSELISRAQDGIAVENVTFATVDILQQGGTSYLSQFLESLNTQQFSFISLFSVTMWLHLHIGDDRLSELLLYFAGLTAGGLLIEPQPWKCYKAAAKRCRKLSLPGFPFALNDLKMKDIDDEISKIVTADGTGIIAQRSLGTEGWGRSLVLYLREDNFLFNQFLDNCYPSL